MATTDIHVHQGVHHHDDHEHDHEHHEGNFWTKYIFSEDHKVIGKQFLFTGIFWALIGGLFSIIFRLQLGFPDASLEWLRPLLGGWINAQGKLDPEFYLALVTMHGTIMVFFVAMPLLLAVFGNFLIPLMIGARDMAFPRLNMLSVWIFALSSIVLFASFFVPGGAAAVVARPRDLVGTGVAPPPRHADGGEQDGANVHGLTSARTIIDAAPPPACTS